MKKGTTELSTIKSRQQAWARLNNCSFDPDGYCTDANANLFGGVLSSAARSEFGKGGGAELGIDGARGKFQALHSSSALACNWFDYWRDREHAPLSTALGLPHPFRTLRFEAKYSTGVRGSMANVDVLLTLDDGSLVAIESKFGEPYNSSESKFLIKPAYFGGGIERWADAGLPCAQRIAESLRDGRHGFHVLDVAQLLKHMLALSRSGNGWKLCCLWYEVPGNVAELHSEELLEFKRLLAEDGRYFEALTYQELFGRLSPLVATEHRLYLGYLLQRYLT